MSGRLRAVILMVRRSLRQHFLSTGVTVLSVALGSGLVMAVFGVSQQAHDAFTGGPVGFDAVLGARGSQLQLVLNTVYHLETSPGNIHWTLYDEVRRDPLVSLAVPLAVGDSFRGFRVVGTTTEMFTEFEYQVGVKFKIRGRGRVFNPAKQEAVIGATVARETGLGVNDGFQPAHGVGYTRDVHSAEYLVVGVMEPTNTPSDRVIWIPIEGIFRLDGHVLRGTGDDFEAIPGEDIPDEHKEISAVMLNFTTDRAGAIYEGRINKQGKVATLAWPIAKSMAELFAKMGWVIQILTVVAYLVLCVAAGSILASIYNSMNERRREFAILRSLGARRGTLFGAIVTEAGVIAFVGAILGYAVYAVILYGASIIVRRETGVVIDLWAWHPPLLWTPIAMTALGVVAGVFPAVRAYSTDVAEHLVPTS